MRLNQLFSSLRSDRIDLAPWRGQQFARPNLSDKRRQDRFVFRFASTDGNVVKALILGSHDCLSTSFASLSSVKFGWSCSQLRVSGYGPVETTRGATSLVLGRQESIGSGVIIDSGGYILTNAHVIRGAHRVQVNISAVANDESPDQSLISQRGRTAEARIIGLDSQIVLALLKVEVQGLRALALSDYGRLRQGDVVFAFGSPEGMQDSVTMGVVSAAARQPDPDSPMVYVQSDAPINPGSSGGPLVNVDGELVGINTFILTEGGGNEGLGFAIPSEIIAFAYPQLRAYGHVRRGKTGIAVQAITPRSGCWTKTFDR